MQKVVSRLPTSSQNQLGYGVNILLLFGIAIVLTAIITMVFAYRFGYYRGYQISSHHEQLKEQEVGMTVDDVKSLKLQAQIMQKERDTAEQERDISLRNFAEQRKVQQELEIYNLQLEQLNDVYAQALSKKGGLPLQIIGAMIEPLPEHAFEYRFDIAMLSPDGKTKQLIPKLTLLDETSLVEVPLQPSEYEIAGVSHIRGRFVMPDGFQPKQVKLNISAAGQHIEQLYNWRLSTPVDNMPLSLAEIPEPDQRPVNGSH